ncbi:hypothetical protein [Synechococcus sp. PCC 7336]|uniref:hypothetical protein n=1 Tax=Synechococcus sp. PCC 7336 TaxID=195250 RepID=UPI00034DDB37|nr:hypothetical protein [Synechococcus sp. PCC 7336]
MDLCLADVYATVSFSLLIAVDIKLCLTFFDRTNSHFGLNWLNIISMYGNVNKVAVPT